jgi:hypothetical protein
LGEVPEELLSRAIVPWQVVYPEEALLFLRTVSFPCNDVISSVLPGIQDDCCKKNDLEQRRYKTESEMPSFTPAFS